MESDDGNEAVSCICSKSCVECPMGFEKIIDLKKAGLVIYRHKVKQNAGNVSATNIDENVFILQNTKGVHLSSSDFLPEMEKNKPECARCRKIIENAQKLLQNVPTINKNDAMGICDHCKLKDQSCYDCKEIIEKFFASKNQIEEGKKKEHITSLLDTMKKIQSGYFSDEDEDGSGIREVIFEDRQNNMKEDNLPHQNLEELNMQNEECFMNDLSISRLYGDGKNNYPTPDRKALDAQVKKKEIKRKEIVKPKRQNSLPGLRLQAKPEEERKRIGDEKTSQFQQSVPAVEKKKIAAENHKQIADEKAKQSAKNTMLPEEKMKAEKERNLKDQSEQNDSIKYNKEIDSEKKNTKKTNAHLKLGGNLNLKNETNKKDEKENKLKSTKEEKIPQQKTKPSDQLKNKDNFKTQVDKSSMYELIKAFQRRQQLKQHGFVDTQSQTEILNKKQRNQHKIKTNSESGTFDSDVEFDYEEPTYVRPEMIKGHKIFKYKTPPTERMEGRDLEVVPQLFRSNYQCTLPEEESTEQTTIKSTVIAKNEQGHRRTLRYALSDRTYIEKGWTVLPIEKVVRKMNVYRMRPAHPEFNWFTHNEHKHEMHYDTGERLADFTANGRGRWYYKSGRVALDYYDSEDLNAQQRFVIYSSGEPDDRGRPRPYTVLATFDYQGNGIVFDHSGKIRLKYNQTEGVVLDRNIGPVSKWKWHTLNDPPILQKVMIDTQMSHKDPEIVQIGREDFSKPRQIHEDMLAIEFDNYIKEKSKKLTQSFKPFQIQMKAMKINENFSLKVLNQATVKLIYRDGKNNLRLNVGMILDHKEIVDTDTSEVGDVSNDLERLPARSDSLAMLQKSIAYAQHFERTRTARERKLRPPKPFDSADKLTAAASRLMRPPLQTRDFCTSPAAITQCCSKYTRTPSSNNFYYNARLC